MRFINFYSLFLIFTCTIFTTIYCMEESRKMNQICCILLRVCLMNLNFTLVVFLYHQVLKIVLKRTITLL